MSKRLEEIKNSYLEGLHSLFGTPWVSMPKENFDWLIEQAERVQELETTVDFYQSALRDADRRVQELEEENRRIRQMKYHEAYEQGKFDTNMKVWYEIPELEQQNKRYREAIEVAINNMAASDNLGVKFALGILEQALEGEE